MPKDLDQDPDVDDIDSTGSAESPPSSMSISSSELPPSFDELDEGVSFLSFYTGTLSSTPSTFKKVGRFEVIRFLGKGGYGVVYLAHDPSLDRLVAIKLCPTSNVQAVEQFRREAMVLARFHHQNIVTVYETGDYDGFFFYAMEYIEGFDGRELIGQSWRRALAVYAAAAAGLATAHDERIAHGDFKPNNLLIGNDGRVCVADFGLASLFEEVAPGDDSKVRSYRAGTPLYMAPELFRGYPPNARSDQWAFCVSLWETIFGELPFKGGSDKELLAAIERTKPAVLVTLVPRAIQNVLRKGLSVDPNDRYADMPALVAALREAAREPPPAPAKAPERSASIGMMALAMLVGAASVLGVVGLLEVPWPKISRRSTAGETTAAEGTDTAAPPAEAVHSPCVFPASRGTPAKVDPIVTRVCARILDGNLDGANGLWDAEYDARELEVEGDDERVILAEDTLIVARTFIAKAESLKSEEGSQKDEKQKKKSRLQAHTAAKRALAWLPPAADVLGFDDPAVKDIQNRVKPFDVDDSTSDD